MTIFIVDGDLTVYRGSQSEETQALVLSCIENLPFQGHSHYTTSYIMHLYKKDVHLSHSLRLQFHNSLFMCRKVNRCILRYMPVNAELQSCIVLYVSVGVCQCIKVMMMMMMEIVWSEGEG